MRNRQFTFKQQMILCISLLLFTTAVGLQIKEYETLQSSSYSISYEYVNIKDMREPHVAVKESTPSTGGILETIQETLNDVEELWMGSPTEVEDFPTTEDSIQGGEAKQIWYLPTENGNVTTYPNYGHVAYDITSWRGTAETIFPVANGTVSGMYTDPNGALIVTVLHEVDGVKYTSQYVHLSSYASGLYIGKPVTIHDALGQMGSTGWSTGVHLHIAVLDCALFDPNDSNCYDLNAWHRYGQNRYSQDFYGLGVLVYVPDSWNSR
ncbi:MAG: peptidoglycan DD-metalloendopeptidase family protein [Bacilli bacterium]|nr:peptidoglycan DD-metalloendopeptidase family protein [Bacilli bacterium]